MRTVIDALQIDQEFAFILSCGAIALTGAHRAQIVGFFQLEIANIYTTTGGIRTRGGARFGDA